MEADVRLSKDFRLSEFTRSTTAQALGIANTPTPEHLENLRELCLRLLQPIRDHFGPVYVTSGYRTPELTKELNGSPTSAHDHGWGADIALAYAKPVQVMEFLAFHKKAPHFFDQAILYPTHVHLGYKHPSTGEQRRQFLVKRKTGFAPWKKGLG